MTPHASDGPDGSDGPEGPDGPDGPNGQQDVTGADHRPDVDDPRPADAVQGADAPGAAPGDRGGERAGPGGLAEQYTALAVADDATMIYDRENHRAWIQSDRAVGVEDLA